MRLRPFAAILAVLSIALLARPLDSPYFVPTHRLTGIGLNRRDLNDEALALRTSAMIQSQTFSIMREPEAVPGAHRIWSSDLQRIFHAAEEKSGFPASVLQAISYLESWGDPKAVSPAGPRGIMQISMATGRRMGLQIRSATKYRTVKTKKMVRLKRGKPVYRTVRTKISYTVVARDERMQAEKAIPAAAMYLAGLEHRYGGRDWAIWAYHCGEGCVADFIALTRGIPGMDSPPASVAKVFFESSPVWNRDLYQAIHMQMDRDYSPTYWFRVMRAQQLLEMYHTDPGEFRDLATEYTYPLDSAQRAPDRLSVWLKPRDVLYTSQDSIRADQTGNLVNVPDDPEFFGYRLSLNGESGYYAHASASTIGTLAYIAFETRQLYALWRPEEPAFVPLEVTALVLPRSEAHSTGSRLFDHATGQVFDISLAHLPDGERECLQFILDDLGWNGYLGFIEEPAAKQTLHIGCSPSSRSFFANVFDDQLASQHEHGTPAPAVPATRR